MHEENPARPSVEQTREFFRAHLVNRGNEALTPDAWAAMADSFADDAEYFEATYGIRRGRPAIRKFLHDSMAGLGDWRFPIEWTEVGEGRVVVHLRNRAPGARRDGSPHEFSSITIVEYDVNGQIVRQMDVYDRLAAIRTLAASKPSLLRARTRRLLGLESPVSP